MSLAEPVRLAEGQVAATGAMLARAFANDPFFTCVLSDPVERSASYRRSWWPGRGTASSLARCT